ncbi:uncharacterized protein ARMOST_17806 [Armillaria ostoyae]|uniref:Nephrocystin 3-like N-terminal domain-containing protein n=1 Tax=Armillaria ostoyae TaxID=47428 RepID=A0A284S018_ARMOS|nr:uncharacterized protein ARMOST_17806 [Armillaria ostoyae]
MADVALGLTSSATVLIQNITTAIKCVKNVHDAPKEIAQFLTELQYTEIYLSALGKLIKLSSRDDPWLETLQQLHGPFQELTELLKGLNRKLRSGSPGWKEGATKLLWTFTKQSVGDDLKKIERLKTLVMSAVQLDDVMLSHAIKDTVADVHGGVSMDDKAEKVARWLTPLDYIAVQQDKLKRRVGNTGEWFLESPEFKSWKDGSTESRTLWCPGSPGVGKTVLASIIANSLQLPDYEETFVQKKTLVLSIFCDYKCANAQTVENVLRSLLKQRVQVHGLSDSIAFLYDDNTPLCLDNLTKILAQELKSFDRVYIILDALDEFPENDGGQEKLISVLRVLGSNTHLLVMSRDIPAIGSLFKTDTWLDTWATDEDIKTYIKTKLSSGRLAHHSKGRGDLREEILSGVTNQADGMFLLAGMHMDSLAETTNRKSLRDALTKLPGNIWEAYDNALERVHSQSEERQELAHRVFGWIAFSRRPLTVLELRYALAVEPGMTTLDLDNLHDEDFLLDVCAGLVVKDETHSEWEDFQPSGAVMNFMHQTTREYFHDRRCTEFFPHIQETITRTCLSYMSLDDFKLPKDVDNADNDSVLRGLAEKHPFLHYSSVHWGYHASRPVEHSMEDEIIAFLTEGVDSANRRKVGNIFHKRTVSSEVPVPFQFAMDYGLLHIVDVLLLRGMYQCEEPLLLTVVHRGDLGMVKLLLDRDNVDPNARSPSSQQTPLLYAVEEQEHTSIMEMLLQSRRVDVNSKGRNGWTPLMIAVRRGIAPTAEALLKHPEIDVFARDDDGKAAYTHAYHSGPDNGGMITLFEKYGCSAELDNYQPIYLTPVNNLRSQ